MRKDKKAQRAVEDTGKKPANQQENPAAGPHAQDHLIDQSKTPGTGTLTDSDGSEVSPGSG